MILYHFLSKNHSLLVCVPTDQTPTPTRFLQNCEEVGLFKEIEEEFLQAEEEEKSKQVHFIAKGKANWISFLSLG